MTHHAARGRDAPIASITLGRGRVVGAPARCAAAAARTGTSHRRPALGRSSSSHDVGHVYSRRTPWAQPRAHRRRPRRSTRASRYSSSGTTARASRRSRGSSRACSCRAKALHASTASPSANRSAGSALSFQHARLQLLRPTVLDEVRDRRQASTTRPRRPRSRAVGLDPTAVARPTGRRAERWPDATRRARGGAREPAARARARRAVRRPRPRRLRRARRVLLARPARAQRGIALDHRLARPAICATDLVDRVVELDRGRVVARRTRSTTRAGARAVTAARPRRVRRAHARGPARARAHLLAPRPRRTRSCTGLWAGTKLVVAAELALLVSISPTWQMIGVGAGVVALGLLVRAHSARRVPALAELVLRRARDRRAASTCWSATKPIVDVGGIALSLGGLERMGALHRARGRAGHVGRAHRLDDAARRRRARARDAWSRPLRWLRLPVDEWVVAIALAIRCLPLLIDEIRTLGRGAAAARARRPEAPAEHPRTDGARGRCSRPTICMATAIVASIRRARDLADAIVARGGLGGSVSAQRSACVSPTRCVLVLATAATAARSRRSTS